MGIILRISELHVPTFVKSRELRRLLDATADAFQVNAPSTNGLSYQDSLKLYAQFTCQQSAHSNRLGRAEQVQTRLYERAFQMGSEYKARLNLRTAEDVMRMAHVIYKLLGIEFHGTPDGNITISHCLFSTYYSSNICSMVSSLDKGLLAGLSGGGALNFSRRITDGESNCIAHLDTGVG